MIKKGLEGLIFISFFFIIYVSYVGAQEVARIPNNNYMAVEIENDFFLPINIYNSGTLSAVYLTPSGQILFWVYMDQDETVRASFDGVNWYEDLSNIPPEIAPKAVIFPNGNYMAVYEPNWPGLDISHITVHNIYASGSMSAVFIDPRKRRISQWDYIDEQNNLLISDDGTRWSLRSIKGWKPIENIDDEPGTIDGPGTIDEPGNDCLGLWVICGIYCGGYPNPGPCRDECLQGYSECMRTGSWPY